MEDALILIDKYAKEIQEDTSIDRLNIMDKQLSSPNVKHKWLFRTIMAKKGLIELVDQKDQLLIDALKTNTLSISKNALAASIEKHPANKKLINDIKKQELLVEYLDRSVDKIFSQMGFDFKNLVELLKLEQV